MNQAHLHLMLNHFPVVGSFFALIILAYAILKSNDEIIKSALKFFVLVGVTAVFAFLTGEPAEEFVEKLSGFSHNATERHEDISKIALIIMEITALASLFFLMGYEKVKKFKKLFLNSLLVLALATCFFMAWTANIGGQIRHSELSSEPVDNINPAQDN